MESFPKDIGSVLRDEGCNDIAVVKLNEEWCKSGMCMNLVHFNVEDISDVEERDSSESESSWSDDTVFRGDVVR